MTNYLLLRGNMGRPGAGVCPVRGHSNVQGDRTMGIFEQMPESFLAALDAEFGFTSPREHGVDAVNAIRAMRDGKADVFIGSRRQLRAGDAGHRGHAPGAAQRRPHRARLDQAEPLAPRTRHPGADPAVPRPHRRGRHRRRAADGHRRGLDGHGAREPRPRDAVVARAAQSEVAIVCGLAAATFGPEDPHPVGRLRSRLLA